MPLGMAEIATVLYSKHLRFDADSPAWWDRDRVVLEHTLELWSMEAIGQCVTSGLGIALMPRVYAREGLARGRFRALAAPPLEDRFLTQVVWRRGRRLSPGAREFLHLTEETARGWREERGLPGRADPGGVESLQGTKGGEGT